MSRRRLTVVVFGVSIAIGLLAAILLPGGGTGQNDQWFILENGRWILENGFPREDPFHVWGGSIVVENWLWSVLMYSTWSLTDSPIIPSIIVWGLVGVLGALAWLISKTVSKSDYAAAVSAIVTVCMVESLNAVVLRPSIATLTLTMLAVLMVLKHRETGQARWLAMIPAIMLIAFNMHMALAWLVILVPGVLMLAAVSLRSIARRWRQALKLVGQYAVTVVASVAVTFANPYGLDGVLFLFKTMGVASYEDSIIELQPLSFDMAGKTEYYVETSTFSWWSIAVLIVLGLIAAVNAHYERGCSTGDEMSSFACLSGFMLLAAAIASSCLVALRMTMLLIYPAPFFVPGVVAVASIAVSRIKTQRLKEALRLSAAVIVVMSALAMPALSTPGVESLWSWEESVNSQKPVKAWEILVRAGAEPGDKVWTDGDFGSFLVWKGFKVAHDMRPELIEPSVNGLPEHHYYDYVDGQLDGDYQAVDRLMADATAAGCKWWVVYEHSRVDDRLKTDRAKYRLVSSIDDSAAQSVNVYGERLSVTGDK